jgi:hypothetical protein
MNKNLEAVYKVFGSNICLAPFIAARYSSASQPQVVQPCSIAYGSWPISDTSIIASMNNNKWKDLRKTFIHGSCHDTISCVTCSRSEKNNTISDRQLANAQFSDKLSIDLVEAVTKIIANDYAVDKIHVLEYFPSNYCNYECIMCNSGASSRRATFESTIRDKSKTINILPTLPTLVSDDFYALLNDIEILNLNGGETLLQPELHTLIDYLIENNLAKNIIITMLTNASSFPHKLINKFKQFKDVFYTISIDGIGDVIEYQRRGAKWVDVEKNAIKINKHFGSVVNYVLTAVNVFSFDNFVDWLCTRRFDIVYISMENVTGYLSVSTIPPELKHPLIEKLQLAKNKYNSDSQCYIDLLDNVITILTTIKHNPLSINQFIQKIRIEDIASKKTLVDVVPEWKLYFE